MADKPANPEALVSASRWRRRILAFFAVFAVVLPLAFAAALGFAEPDSRGARVFGFWNAMARMAAVFIGLGLALNWMLLVVAWLAPRRIVRAWPAVSAVTASIVGALLAMALANLVGNMAIIGLFAILFFPGKSGAVLNQGTGALGALMIFAAPILCGIGWYLGRLASFLFGRNTMSESRPPRTR